MRHVVLLGDSTLDNGAYVGDGSDVVAHLRTLLGDEGTATLLAVDGSMIDDIADQFTRLPKDTTHIVISVGGNDALDRLPLLDQPAFSVGAAVAQLAQVRSEFAARYEAMIERAITLGHPVAVATIYDANLEPPLRDVIPTAVSVFDDAITRLAFARGVDLIDLRLTCNRPEDFANPIEPSVTGGAKIARAIAAFVTAEPLLARHSRVFF